MMVFKAFRRLLAALEAIDSGLRSLTIGVIEATRVQLEQGPARERLELLEQGRHQFEALCEGLLLKAEGKWRAANNAEARERQMRKSYEHLIDPLTEDGEPAETAVGNPDSNYDATAGEAERLSALRLDVATNHKARAQSAKWGTR